MGVYANGMVVYGFVETRKMRPLFQQIENARKERGKEEENDEEDEEGTSFEELFGELQKKYDLSFFTVGYDGEIRVIAAFSAASSGKGADIEEIEEEDMKKTDDYKQRVCALLKELEIDTGLYQPGWYVLSYMD